MANRRSGVEGGAWIQALGQSLGAQLGRAIAESLQQTLEASIDVAGIAARLGGGATAGRRRRGRKVAGAAVCSEAGCGRAVLAKGLCRSHYYKARYRAQKDGSLVPKKRGQRRPGRPPKSAKAAAPAHEELKPETAAE
jgi:hypothetical protein